MPDSPTTENKSEFVCDCEEWMRPACINETFYRSFESQDGIKRYCVLHFPAHEKVVDFANRLQIKLDKLDYDFRGVWFPDEPPFAKFEFSSDADFRGATFAANANFVATNFKARADFFRAVFLSEASFANAVFGSDADFYDATFRADADFRAVSFNASIEFRGVTFSRAANFRYAAFKNKANFRSANFNVLADFFMAAFGSVVDLSSATFTGEANFNRSVFNARADFSGSDFDGLANFSEATFSEAVIFAGNEDGPVFSGASSMNLQFARFEKAELVSFHTLALHPSWFVNADARKFSIVNVHWKNYGNAKSELDLLKSRQIPSRHRLLAVTCRKLAANAEENDRFREASQFRRMAMDSERLEDWHGFDFRRLSWWYWFASGYGERPLQALVVLFLIWLIFAVIFTQVGFARWEPRLVSEADSIAMTRDNLGASLSVKRAMMYSAGVITLQKPEPRPATATAQILVLLETILGPVQAALLALAIRRKFMR
jgi:uncharacterized protein YjbI with pentapeptide repeats